VDYEVIEARYVRDYVVWLRFRDGRSGEIDLEPELRGPVFEPLKDLRTFQQFYVHPEFATLVWPNDADIAPEFLHDNVRPANPPTSRDTRIGESPTSASSGVDSRGSEPASALPHELRSDRMPEISRFFGIVVTMYYDEHGQPHFQARAGQHLVSIEIQSLIVRGEFPGVKLRLVLDWADLHRAELLENWERARRGLPLLPIEPLK
jgi:hypothetical protein